MIGIQVVSLCHFHICIYCTLFWFIPSIILPIPPLPFLKEVIKFK
jgi:hypothetical protein